MDPVTLSLIGAGIAGGSSLLGGYMNTSSAQAINSQNLQAAMAMRNTGLISTVAQARQEGINPLAALGVSGGPGFSMAQPTDPGAGVISGGQAAGKILASIDPYVEERKNLDVEKARVDIANARIAGNNTAQQVARDSMINQMIENYISRHPDAIPEGVQQPTVPTMFNDFGAGALNNILSASQSYGRSLNEMFSWPSMVGRKY